MDFLLEIATEYTKLFDKDFLYYLENGMEIQIYFTPKNFHHLIGFQKLKDLDLIKKSSQNNTNYIFKNILKGIITYDDVKKSQYFSEIEHRLSHFKQINKIIEFEKMIIDFNPELITSKIEADYILFKKSKDNMYLNLFLTAGSKDNKIQIPNTFIPHSSDYYTYGQKELKIVSMNESLRKKNIKN